MVAANPLLLERRRLARAELARVDLARAEQVASICAAGPTHEERALVDRHVRSLPGPLGAAWAEFCALPAPQQAAALREPSFAGMPWHSLLQCNPYALLPRWRRIAARWVA